MLRNTIILFFVSIPMWLFSQGQSNIWYFGSKVGLNFGNGSPEILIDGEMEAFEGCATISNALGELLFYTNGMNVYNRNHQLMLNGTGLSGNSHSTQSAIIIPKPNSENLYYIFTIDAFGQPNGLRYTEVDMTLDNGLGAVTDNKNVLLITPVSEQLVASKINQQDAYWIMCHKYEGSEYLSFKVSEAGVSTEPVISNVGSYVDSLNFSGQIKFSHQGNRLAHAKEKELQIFDFNYTTGELSNAFTFTFDEQRLYGLEFSPNGNFLYVTSSGLNSNDEDTIHQFDLRFNDDQLIMNSEIKLVQDGIVEYGSMQLAPDGKIYIAKAYEYSLDVLENPDQLGFVGNFNSNGLNLGDKISYYGLPSFTEPIFSADFEICISDTANAQFFSEVLGSFDNLIWDFGDNTSSTENFPSHIYNTSGEYEVNLTVFSGNQEITVTKSITILGELVENSAEIIVCDDNIQDGITTFQLNNYWGILLEEIDNNSNYDNVKITFFEDEAFFNQIEETEYDNTSNPQTIFAKIEDLDTDCFTTIEVVLSVRQGQLSDLSLNQCVDVSQNGFTDFNLQIVTDQILGDIPISLPINYYLSYNDALIEENPLPLLYTNQIPYNQVIYAKPIDGEECYGIVEVELKVYENPEIIELDEIFICTNSLSGYITLDAGLSGENPDNYNIMWSTGDTTNQIQVDSIGIYTVTVSSENGCSTERVINVEWSSIATIETINITDVSENNTISILVSGEGEYVYALDDENGIYQESNSFDNVSPGFHTVFVKDIKSNCGIVSEAISVIGFPKFFTPNGDTENDTWKISGFSPQFPVVANVQIFDRYGKLITVLNENNTSWDGQFNGVMMPTSDYWFVANLHNGRTIKGHFTLKK